LSAQADWVERQALIAHLAAFGDKMRRRCAGAMIRLDGLLQFGGDSKVVSRVTAEFVRLGIHSFDEVGRRASTNGPVGSLRIDR